MEIKEDEKMTTIFTVLTLNVWGIPYVSLDRGIRMQAIAEKLAEGDYDIVSLQEVWSEKDFQLLKQNTKHTLPYAHYFYSGVAGSGLCLLSKYPIVAAFFHAWPLNGYVHRIQHGDWFGGKGVGLCKILVNNQLVNVYIAHLHAEYDNENDEYKAHRIIQAFDAAQFIETTRSNAVLQILAGDLNIEPHDIAYRVLLNSAHLTDACQKNQIVGTNECENNSYTDSVAAKKNPIGKRIDHLLIRSGDGHQAFVKEFKLPFPNRIDGKNFSYSDHEAVYAKIEISAKGSSPSSNSETGYCDANTKSINGVDEYTTESIGALQECIAICNKSLQQLNNHRTIYILLALFAAFILFVVIEYSQPSYGLKTFLLILKLILSGFVIFFVFMASLWNMMERHSILSGKLSMEILLRNIEKCK